MATSTGTPTIIHALLEEAGALDREGFESKYPDPFLVAVNWRQTAWSGATESTISVDLAAPLAARIRPDAPAWVVSKRSRNDLPDIALGRSPRSDVVVPEPGISKMHCTLRLRDGGWQVTDLESRNGTNVDGTDIEPLRAHPLEVGATIRLGPNATFLFLRSGALWDALDEIRRAA
jgi:pSer/pThr/pTyr-binding forkhead associated (FHA) protein